MLFYLKVYQHILTVNMLAISYFIIILSICKVNLTVTEIQKYVPGEDVLLYCNVNITSYRAISWFFENNIIWTGNKLNKMSNNSLRYEITEKMNLRIKNTSIDDEGKYTCLPVPPVINQKYTVTLKSEPIVRKTDSNNNDSLVTDVNVKKTTVETTWTGKYTTNPDDVSNCHRSGQWIEHSLISVSILSAILIGLLCVLLYKYRKSRYISSSTGIHSVASEIIELNDNQHVYNIIDDHQLEDLMHDQAIDVSIGSERTNRSDQSDDHFIQYDDSEYLHPYHSLVPVIYTEKQDYEQINVQNKEDVYNDTSRRTGKSRTPIRLVSDNRILSNSDCTSDDLKRADVCKFVCHSNSDNKDTNQPDQTITNVTQKCNLISDNISLD